MMDVRAAYDYWYCSNIDVVSRFGVHDKVINSADLLRRNLDCSVLESLHAGRMVSGEMPYDSVRGVFVEGKPLYEGAGIYDKTHVQICIRNPNCILGFFLPREQARWP